MTQPLTFEVMVMDDNILLKAINEFNMHFNTDFKIIHTEYDEVIFCTIEVSNWTYEELFNLGHYLSIVEHEMRERGEFDW
ncbi:hypothetical protein LNQ82_02420 [Conchiformibius steedae DSM 2580]|uniref:Uncharacterized protein n=1 Tax=Conchiformibius steedae DSM 2580 TaxID=1121352 RepID=A0AAE9HTS1_9NEIS|nr:hypothetical protein [Conchiformibius steedae]QMT33387.1 hypothetical protein H3L98_09945 [Conchiformibius steedae]URD68037.1 hypothetical protein LNQ82_02420 [Conchiformibius steedae DSM 2580]